MRSNYIATFALLLCLCTVASAQQGDRAAPPAVATKMIIRSYDVSELLRPSRNYPYDSAVIPPTELNSGSNGLLTEPVTATVERDDLLDATAVIDLVLAMVDPDSWDGWRPERKQATIRQRLFTGNQDAQEAAQPSASGDKARLRMLGTSMVILQTEENHKRIAELLTQLRKEAGPLRLVTVRANWLLLDPADVDGILKSKSGDGKSATVQEVDLSALEKSAGKSIRYRGQTTCFNGQTTHIASGRGRTVVHGLQAVVGQGVGMQDPIVSLVHSGAILQLTPLLSPDGATAVLDVQSVVSESDPTPPQAAASTSQPAPFEHHGVDRLNMIVHQLKTSLRLPTNKPVLVGGMTLEPSTRSDGKQLYLVLEVTTPQG